MKRVIMWDYERGTWQYDVFCLLIIAFIFLTPKDWFHKIETSANPSRAVAVKTEMPEPFLTGAAEVFYEK